LQTSLTATATTAAALFILFIPVLCIAAFLNRFCSATTASFCGIISAAAISSTFRKQNLGREFQ
jgi:hypothetical protein